jgi:hypothetical protein
VDRARRKATHRRAMKASYAGPLTLAAILVTSPVTASPAVIAVVAALAAGVGVSASQQPYETWQYTAKYGWVGGARDDVSTVEQPLSPKSGTPQSIVSACRDALMRLAQPHDVASMAVEPAWLGSASSDGPSFCAAELSSSAGPGGSIMLGEGASGREKLGGVRKGAPKRPSNMLRWKS